MVYRLNSRTLRVIQRNPVSKANSKTKKQNKTNIKQNLLVSFGTVGKRYVGRDVPGTNSVEYGLCENFKLRKETQMYVVLGYHEGIPDVKGFEDLFALEINISWKSRT